MNKHPRVPDHQRTGTLSTTNRVKLIYLPSVLGQFLDKYFRNRQESVALEIDPGMTYFTTHSVQCSLNVFEDIMVAPLSLKSVANIKTIICF